MPINAKDIIVTNKDDAHIGPKKPKLEIPKSTSKPIQPVQKQTKRDDVIEGLFVKKRSKFLDDMTTSE